MLTSSTFGCDDMTPRRNRNADESREVASVVQNMDFEKWFLDSSLVRCVRSDWIELTVIRAGL